MEQNDIREFNKYNISWTWNVREREIHLRRPRGTFQTQETASAKVTGIVTLLPVMLGESGLVKRTSCGNKRSSSARKL